jgi:hypothetical protein
MLILLLGSAVVCPSTAKAQTVHALLVIMDDAPRTRELNLVNMKNIGDLLRDVEAEYNCPLTLDVLRFSSDDNQAQATSENILKWLAAVRPAPDDVVFVYYSGRGGMDKTVARQLYLTLQDGNFPRQQIVEGIDRLECRLKMLITDTVSFDVIWDNISTFWGGSSKALGHLFFAHEGFLNITSASEGELSGGASLDRSERSDEEIKHGGWFTYALIEEIYTDHTDTNEDGFVSWEEVFQAARAKTIDLFWRTEGSFSEGLARKFERIGQQTQRPIYYGELPRRIGATESQTLHALLVSMEENLLDTGDSVMKARDEIEWLLDDLAETANCPVNITHLFASEGEATPDRIQQWVQDVRPARDDVVLLYYIGDGTADENGELYLDLFDNEKISRKAIADSLHKLTGRLKIFITDAGSQGPPVTEPVDFLANRYRANVSNGVSRAEMFKPLFFEHEGFLDLTAATEGEFAFGNSEGRLFTQALVHAIYKYEDYRSPFMSWADVFKLTRQKTIDLFHAEASEFPDEMKQQLREKQVESQRPKFYGELPRRIER